MNRTLADWLHHIEVLHHRPVDMGLDRVRAVATRLGLEAELTAARIVVGGTNGKGSTCAMLDAIYRAAGYRVGRYASPHLTDFTERASIDGRPAAPDDLAAHFAAVEAARGGNTLTYFEFSTLAVLSLFARARLDVVVLEVGLGGRLDAVNIVDGDCAVVTTIDLDHTELLGPTREAIGFEKAHIFRPGRPAICVDPQPPASLIETARACGAQLRCLGKDFSVEAPAPAGARQWNYLSRLPGGSRMALPWPALRGSHQLRNAAGALAAIEALSGRRPVDQQAVRQGLVGVQLAGRFQVIPGRPAIILDVAHNPHAARALSQALREYGAGPAPEAGRVPVQAERPGRTLAVFGMLRDKDSAEVVRALEAQIDAWHLAATQGERGQEAAALLRAAFSPQAAARCATHAGVAEALDAAVGGAGPDDRIVVFGSFVIVADAMRWLERRSR